MIRLGITAPLLFLIAFATTSCVSETVPITSQPKPVPAKKSSGGEPAEKPPAAVVVSLWENGDFRQGKSPQILFAMYSDGTVVRQLSGHIYVGRAPQAQVKQLLDALEIAGARQTVLTTGAVYPDGPSQLLWAMIGGQEVVLTNDTNFAAADLDRLAAPGSPGRQQLDTFLEMWSRCLAAIWEVWPPTLEQAQFVAGLHYPSARLSR
jgi:hypothetical protein